MEKQNHNNCRSDENVTMKINEMFENIETENIATVEDSYNNEKQNRSFIIYREATIRTFAFHVSQRLSHQQFRVKC